VRAFQTTASAAIFERAEVWWKKDGVRLRLNIPDEAFSEPLIRRRQNGGVHRHLEALLATANL
jgi:hypothetical protein